MPRYFIGLYDSASYDPAAQTKAPARGIFRGSGWIAQCDPCADRANESQVSIHATSRERVERLVDLILGCLSIVHASHPMVSSQDLWIGSKRLPGDIKRNASGDLPPSGRFHTTDVLRACELAAIASRNRNHVIAVMRHLCSVSIVNSAPQDLEPFRDPLNRRTPFEIDWMQFAAAITMAYAGIEQLGVHIEGNVVKDGAWIPTELDRFESKLEASGLTARERFVYHRRTPTRRVDRRTKRGLATAQRAPWAESHVRDITIELPDALLIARELRNKAGAHRLDKEIESLRLQDVVFVQRLLRGILSLKLRHH